MKTTLSKVLVLVTAMCMMAGMVQPLEAAATVVYKSGVGGEKVRVVYENDEPMEYSNIAESLSSYEIDETAEAFELDESLLTVENYSYDSEKNAACLRAVLKDASGGLDVLAAVYDGSGRLVGVSMKNTDSVKSIDFSVELKDVPEGAYKLKVFALKSIHSLKPVALAETTYIFDEGEYSLGECGSVYIDAAGVRLKDTDVKKDITISDRVGSGNVEMKNVDVAGNIYVNGGGTNSVLFGSVTVKGAVVVNKVGDDIRIVVTNESSMDIRLDSGAIIITDGSQKIGEVRITEGLAGKNIVLDGSFGKVTGDAAGVNIDAAGDIEEVVLNKSATITGNAVIGKVEAKEGADSVVNGTDISGGSSVTLPGPSLGAAKEAAKYERAVTISADINEGEDVTDKIVVLKSGESDDWDYSVSITEKADIGDYLTVTSDSVVLKRQAKSYPGYAVLTLTFTNRYDDTDEASVNVSVTISPPGWQDPENVDDRFARGYPKVEVDPETNYMMLKLKLKDGVATKDNPVEAFMVLNQINSGYWEADTRSVVHGHDGEGDHAIYVDEWPYVCIEGNEEYTVKTRREIKGVKGITAYFVLSDTNRISEAPTVVRFDVRAVKEMDNRAPKLWSAYINKARNRIFMYYDEILDPESVPAAGSFAVSGATVNKVTIEEWGNDGDGLVILDISGISSSLTDEQIGSDITVSYTPPSVNKLRDTSVNHNECEKTTMTVDVATVLLDTVNVSVDKQYIHIVTVNNEDFYCNGEYEEEIRYGKSFDESTVLQYQIVGRSSSSYGGDSDIYLKCQGDESIFENEGKLYVSLVPQGEMYDYAQDRITETLTVEALPESVSSKAVKAEYDGINLKLTMQGCEDDSFAIALCSFTLSVNGKPYVLRGFRSMNEGILNFNSSNIPVKIKAEDKLRLTYEPQHGSYRDVLLTEPSGRPIDTFKDMEVENLMK